MSVLIVTSLGDIVVDLFTDKCPLTSKNFLKLCKIKYYNGCLFHTVQKDFTAQTGDPTGTGSGGDSVYKFLYGEQARFFTDVIHLDMKHNKTGTVAMASAGENLNASQFYFTLRDDLDYLDGKHTVFGEIAEGFETLTRINEAFVDEKGRPLKNIRIKHTYILDDPFDDPSQLAELIPGASPEGKPKDEVDDDVRLEDDWVPLDEQIGAAELEEVLRTKEAHSSAVVLESIGDIPDAEIKPPDNVLFVCKLNPVTEDEDLHTIFSRFGTVLSAEIIRDFKTGDSLCYAFIEFETREACEQAYFKMDNALIDDRRIHVDFSQSVSKLWSQYWRKNHQMGKGKGCFKCGASDHIAKDCTGGPVVGQQPQKYVLKDDNLQHGGGNNSSYEMVFDGDPSESPRQRKRNRGRDVDDRDDKQKITRQNFDDSRHRGQEKRESDRPRQSDRSRGYRGDELRWDNKESRHGGRSSRDYHEEHSREKHKATLRDLDDNRVDQRDYRKRTTENGRHAERRDSGDSRKVANLDRPSEKSTDRDYSKTSADNDSRAEKRRDGDHRKRSVDYNNSHGDGRDDRDYRKRNRDGHDERDDRDYRKKNRDGDGDDRETRDESLHRKRSTDDNHGHKDRREEWQYRMSETRGDDDRDRDRERRHQAEKRK